MARPGDERREPLLGERTKADWATWARTLDWGVYLLAFAAWIWAYFYTKRDPYLRDVYPADAHHWHEVHDVAVTPTWNWLFLIPVLLVHVLVESGLWGTRHREAASMRALRLALGLVTALVLTWSVTMLAKNYVGWLRPNAVRACLDGELPAAFTPKKCTHAIGSWERQSFPSKDAAIAAAMATYTVLYLNTAASIAWSDQVSQLLHLLSFFPVLWAGWVGADRIRNNWHFPADVIGGYLVGATMAALVYARMASMLFAPQTARGIYHYGKGPMHVTVEREGAEIEEIPIA
eukprot:jgi/Chlat1/5886/Chrsp4S09094